MDKNTFDSVKEKIDSYLYRTRNYRYYSNYLNIYEEDFFEDVSDTDTGYYEVIEKVYLYKLRQIMNEWQPQLNNDIVFFFKYVILFYDEDDNYAHWRDSYERCNNIYFNCCYHLKDCDCERCRNRYSHEEYWDDDDDFCYEDCECRTCERCNVKSSINGRLANIHRKYGTKDDLKKEGCNCIDNELCTVCWDNFYGRVRRNDRYQWYIFDMFKRFEKEILDFKNI